MMQSRFGIELDPTTLLLIPLECRYLVEDGTWKRFTLLGQSLGSIWLALEGLRKGLIPDIWIGMSSSLFHCFRNLIVSNCRYNGLRLRLSTRQSTLSDSSGQLYALSNHQVRSIASNASSLKLTFPRTALICFDESPRVNKDIPTTLSSPAAPF